MSQRQLPDGLYVAESGTTSHQTAGGIYLNESTSSGVGTAPGATITGTSTITPGAASGTSPGVAPAATMTGTATITPGTATGGGSAGGTLTTRPQHNNTGTLMANETGAEVFIFDQITGTLVLRATNVSLNASGVAVITNAALVPGTAYCYDVKLTGNRRRMNPKAAT